jgi:hypothetical protein
MTKLSHVQVHHHAHKDTDGIPIAACFNSAYSFYKQTQERLHSMQEINKTENSELLGFWNLSTVQYSTKVENTGRWTKPKNPLESTSTDHVH